MSIRFSSPDRKFVRDSSGSVAVMFAGSALMLVLAVGLAVDYSALTSLKTKLQITTDSALLSATLTLRISNSSTATKTAIITSLKGALPEASLVGEPVISNGNTSICATTTVTYNPVLMKIVGFNQVPIKTYSCAKYDISSFEIALVLDTSGSMNDNDAFGKTKIQSMKDQAAKFLTDIGTVAQGRAVFSVVPFATTVNIGSQYRNAWFMDSQGRSSTHFIEFSKPSGVQPGLVPTPSRSWAGSGSATMPWYPRSKFELFDGIGVPWAGCVMGRPVPYMTTDDAPNAATPDTLFVPFFWPDESDSGGTSGGSYNNYLKDTGVSTKYIGSVSSSDMCGYKVSGSKIYETADTAYASRYGSPSQQAGPTAKQSMVCKYYGQQATTTVNSGYGSSFKAGPNLLCNSNTVTTLTSDTTSLINKIGTFQALGGTNIFSALMWGWRTISPNGPFRNGTGVSLPVQPLPYGYISSSGVKNNKVIVLMTDGYNTEDLYNTHSYKWLNWLQGTTMDSKTLEACANAKAAGVVIYTVGFYTSSSDSASEPMLKQCATSPSFFYRAEDGAQLAQAFKSIAASISKLRVSE